MTVIQYTKIWDTLILQVYLRTRMMGVLLLVITHYGTVILDTTCRNYESSLCQTSAVLLISNRLIVIGLHTIQ